MQTLCAPARTAGKFARSFVSVRTENPARYWAVMVLLGVVSIAGFLAGHLLTVSGGTAAGIMTVVMAARVDEATYDWRNCYKLRYIGHGTAACLYLAVWFTIFFVPMVTVIRPR